MSAAERMYWTAADVAAPVDEPPGEFPFTRGIHRGMYRDRLWTMRQYAGLGDAGATNARFRHLLAEGQTGLSVAFDLPTQLGLDSDDPPAAGEVGKVGVAVSTVEDMDELFAGIPLDRISASMTINATAAVLFAFYLVLARRRGIAPDRLSGTVQNDILKEYIARGTYIFPVRPSLRLALDLWEYARRTVPRWYVASISGYHIREAGATAVQELAFTFANARAYLAAAQARGLDLDDLGPRLSFFFGAHNDLLEEVAKFRAARRIWARLMRDRLGARNPASWALRFHTQTCGSTLTAQQPMVNIVRVAYQALAAVLGGTQSLHTNSFDEALALPSTRAATIALRTQQIAAAETGIANTVDPLGGAYQVEARTVEIEAAVEALLVEIDRDGGAIAAIEQGTMARAIEESAYAQHRRIEDGRAPVVGVNVFTVDEATAIDRPPDAAELTARRAARLAAWRRGRDPTAVRSALAALTDASRGDANLMEPIINAAEAGSTLGETCTALRAVFGRHDRRG